MVYRISSKNSFNSSRGNIYTINPPAFQRQDFVNHRTGYIGACCEYQDMSGKIRKEYVCCLLAIGRLLRPDIVHFHFTCLGTEIFLRELTLSNTLSLNPKSSRSVDLHFLTNCNFIFTNFTTTFFIVQQHGSMTTNDYVTQKDQFLLASRGMHRIGLDFYNPIIA